MKIKYLIILLVVVTALTYHNTLNNKFTPEDYYLITNNKFISCWENVGVLFSIDNLLKPEPIVNGARPLTLFSLMLDYKIWRYNPFGYHLTNIILHLLNCIMVFFLFRKLQVNNDISFVTAVIYALHPIQGEVVNVPGFRGDLLAAFFFLSGIIFFINIIEKKKYIYLLPLVLSYIFALMSKEVAVTLPLVLLLYLFVKKISFRRILLICMPLLFFGMLYLVYFWWERYNYNIFETIFVNLTGSIRPLSSVSAYFNTIIITLFHYIKSLFMPFYLAYDYQLSIPGHISFISIISCFFIIIMVYGLMKIKDKTLKFAVGIALITYLPVSNLLPLPNIVADRYLYIPMIGISFILFKAAAYVINNLPNRLIKIKKYELSNYSMISILLLNLYYGISFNRNYVYRNTLMLYKNSIIKSPNNVRVNYNLAIAHRELGDWNVSNKYLEKVLKLNSLYKTSMVWQMMAENYQMLGKKDQAKKYYIKVLLLNPNKEIMNNLAGILFKEGDKQASRKLWEKLLEIYPKDKMEQSWLNALKNINK